MSAMRGGNRVKAVGLVLAAVFLGFLAQVCEAQPSGDTVVYGEGKRVHVVGCRRLTKDRTELGKMKKWTLAQAEAAGAMLCSRCPGSETPGRGNPHLLEGGGAGAAAPAAAGGGDLPESWVKPAPAEIPTHQFTPSPLAPLISMGSDGKLVYKPYSNRGDMLMDWSYCGYKNSSVPIPMVRVVETLEPLPGDASPVGNLKYPMGPDSRGRIQAAIDKVAKMQPDADGARGAVLLKKGTYYINGSLGIKSGVVLRGEGGGDDGTILIMRSAKGGGSAISLGSGSGNPQVSEDSVRITNSYLPSGSLKLDVADASGFKPGDTVVVRKTVNDAWIEHLGMGERLRHIRGGKEGSFKKPWVAGAYQVPNFRTLVAVNGNTLTLDGVLPQSFDQEHGGGAVHKADLSGLSTHSSVEFLQLVSNYATKPQGRGKKANFFNFKSGVEVGKTVDSWVRGCTIKHVSFAAVRGAKGGVSLRITVRDTKALEPVGPKAGGFRYAFTLFGGSQYLIYNCYSEDGRHCFSTGSRVQGPNAFVNSVAVRGGQSEPHHRWSTGVLYDNVITKDGTLAAINRGDSGSGHGWAGANTLFWNCDAKSIVVMNPETEGENNFAIGYSGDSQGDKKSIEYSNNRAGYWQTPLEGKYYGYALMGSGYIESPDGPVKPDSLFVQQLIDRIGADRAAAVLK